MRVLNRVIEWCPEGIKVESDQRHVEIIVKELGLEKANGVGTPGTKDKEVDEEAEEELGAEEARAFRSVAARINFLAADRPELLYSAKEVCRDMTSRQRGHG